MHLHALAGARRRTWRALLAAALPAALAASALPAAANAADVTAVGTEIVVEDRAFKVGDNNRLIAEALPGGELRLVDQVPLVSKTDTCIPVTSFEVRCIRPSTSPISKLVYLARGGNDQLRPAGSLPIKYQGGSGDDLYIGARTAAPTHVDFEGGGDVGDLAHYTNAQTGVQVSKDDIANDGRPGINDRDNIRKDVEVVTGTQFADRFSGTVVATGFDEFRPLGGNDLITGGDAPISVVDMGAAKDGADKVVGGLFTQVSYAKRTNPVRASIGFDGADDGEAGEGDELVGVREVLGGSGDDTMFAATRPDSFGIELDGGLGDDEISGTDRADRLTGGPDRDTLSGRGGNDVLIADDGDVDHVFCGLGFGDTARTDTAELTVSGCEDRTVGVLRLSPKSLRATAGEPVRLRLAWRHPAAWKQLRTIELRLMRDGLPGGEVTIRPRGERIAADGAVKLLRKRSRLTGKGKTVAARLVVRFDESLAGQTLKTEVEATDRRGRRQLERDAGRIRVSS